MTLVAHWLAVSPTKALLSFVNMPSVLKPSLGIGERRPAQPGIQAKPRRDSSTIARVLRRGFSHGGTPRTHDLPTKPQCILPH